MLASYRLEPGGLPSANGDEIAGGQCLQIVLYGGVRKDSVHPICVYGLNAGVAHGSISSGDCAKIRLVKRCRQKTPLRAHPPIDPCGGGAPRLGAIE